VERVRADSMVGYVLSSGRRTRPNRQSRSSSDKPQRQALDADSKAATSWQKKIDQLEPSSRRRLLPTSPPGRVQWPKNRQHDTDRSRTEEVRVTQLALVWVL